MTDTQPAQFDWATELSDAQGHVTLSKQEAKEIGARLRRLHAYCQELESQVILDCMTHVQNPAEIEHVAGVVSKNGAEVNTNVYAELPPRYYLAGGVEKTWDQQQMCVFADATHALRAPHGQAPSQAGEYPALVCDYCGALTPDPWHSSGMLHGKMSKHIHSCDACAARAPADSVTAPAGGANWQDISTAPKDGTRFVAVGQNYGLDSETQHTCIAQWLAGCWIEVSDWNEASELKYLTHWMPLPPLPGSAARAPADSVLEDAARLLESQHTWLTNVAAANLVRSLAARKQGANHD